MTADTCDTEIIRAASPKHRKRQSSGDTTLTKVNEVKKARPGTPPAQSSATADNNPAWGIFKNREHFVDLHLC